jgi:uncharacterized membrane protein
MIGNLVRDLRPLIHPIVVHFPIALLFTSVALDWAGYVFQFVNLTRAGFYLLVAGAFGAGVAALTGPDHAAGDSTVVALLTAHQSFALVTVALAVALAAVRFLAIEGIQGRWAVVYLGCTLALLATLALTGYYGGELTYHQGVGVLPGPAASDAGTARGAGSSLVPVKPVVALLGMLCVVGLAIWLLAGRTLAGAYYSAWSQAVRGHLAGAAGPLWTLRHRATRTARGHSQLSRSPAPPVPTSTPPTSA